MLKGHIRDTKVVPSVAKSHLRRGSSTEVAREAVAVEAVAVEAVAVEAVAVEAVAVEAVRCVPGGSSLLRCLHS
jgi:hypothetical protein